MDKANFRPTKHDIVPLKVTARAMWYLIGFESDVSRITERNKEFWLRVAIPQQPIRGPDGKPSSVVVMLNGVAEAKIELYDVLIESIAEKGLVSILLPLPNHFTRYQDASAFRDFNFDNNEDPFEIRGDSTEIIDQKLDEIKTTLADRLTKSPGLWVEGYEQAMADIDILLKRVLKERKADDPLSNLLSVDVRLSLYGYSLGGLISLSMLFKDPNLFQAAFIVNSGADIRALNPSRVFKKWPTIVEGINDFFGKNQHKLKYPKEFKLVFLNTNTELRKKKLDAIKRKTLFVLGGKDDVYKISEVLKLAPKDGITAMLLPAVGHWITGGRHRQEWDRWRRFLVQLIADYESSHAPDNIFDQMAQSLAQRITRLSPQERIRAKLVLYDERTRELVTAGKSSNLAYRRSFFQIFEATRLFCQYCFEEGKASQIYSVSLEELHPGEYGITPRDLKEYKRMDIRGVVCVPFQFDGTPSGENSGILVVASDWSLKTSALKLSNVERLISSSVETCKERVVSNHRAQRLLADLTCT